MRRLAGRQQRVVRVLVPFNYRVGGRRCIFGGRGGRGQNRQYQRGQGSADRSYSTSEFVHVLLLLSFSMSWLENAHCFSFPMTPLFVVSDLVGSGAPMRRSRRYEYRSRANVRSLTLSTRCWW